MRPEPRKRSERSPVTTKRKIVYAVVALLIAIVGQHFWSTLYNPLVWHLTYLGVHLARAIHQPNYDSVASARLFNALAILINALVYFAILIAGERSRARLKKRAIQK